MQRVCFYLRLYPGTETAYDRRHSAVWPELAAEIREAGLRNMTGFRRGTDVWYYVEAEPDALTAFAEIGRKPANRRWDRYFREIIAQHANDAGEMIRYDEIFHVDGDPTLTGPFQRELLTLVIDPERAADYDALHADPWPEMVAAIAAAGTRNTTGFRRDAQVVFYGEHYPDLATVYDRITQMEVDARWGASFEGVVTTMTDGDGQLIIAHEVFHQD